MTYFDDSDRLPWYMWVIHPMTQMFVLIALWILGVVE